MAPLDYLIATTQQLVDAKKAGDERGVLDALHNVAHAHVRSEQYDKAIAVEKGAMVTAQKLQDRPAELDCLEKIFDIHRASGSWEGAMEAALDAQKSFQALQDKSGEVRALCLLSKAHQLRAELELADGKAVELDGDVLKFAQEAQELAAESGDPVAQGYALLRLAEAHEASGEGSLALSECAKASSILQQADDMVGLGASCITLADMLLGRRDFVKAVEVATTASEALEAAGDSVGWAKSLERLAEAHVERSQFADASVCLMNVVNIYRQWEHIRDTGGRLMKSAAVYVQACRSGEQCPGWQHKQAVSNARDAAVIFEELGQYQDQAAALIMVGEVHMAKDSPSNAVGVVRRAITVYRAHNDVAGIRSATMMVAQIQFARAQSAALAGENVKADQYYSEAAATAQELILNATNWEPADAQTADEARGLQNAIKECHNLLKPALNASGAGAGSRR
eukprot:gnl/TRDRNA2_/TRDRNA2_196722_c0_seq1.p1 gnl/TRDRNA2_/TRDRNA2_196722_c0~~gnl/TRDRNA2_/TRDRNA2_196722_c0_seq1.p1  ORF type:complete len:455 (+),score=108.71 gnl/TRDRNA2_/TRDRNA2_196722_c0_seq1:51-1415(+)